MRAGLAAALALGAGAAFGHEATLHPEPIAAAAVFPSAIGGPFLLVDQTGAARSEADPHGRPQLLFFGYAACSGVCSVVLPTLGALTDALLAEGIAATPVLVTVDPARDTAAALAEAAPRIHPALVALTGSDAALAAARAAFQVESTLLFVGSEQGPEQEPVYAHGSYIYLLDGAGRFLTLLPPVLSVERMVEIVAAYVRP